MFSPLAPYFSASKTLLLRRLQPILLSGPLFRGYSRNSGPLRRHAARHTRSPVNPWIAYPSALLFAGGVGWITYENVQPFRHTVLAVSRCALVAESAILGVVDYKVTFWKTYASEEEKLQAYSECHTRSAKRVLSALLANGGIFIKLGQHVSSLIVLPVEWTTTMRPLQDQCEPTPYEDLAEMVKHDTGKTIDELFSEFKREPIGVASLAQVHYARLRESGEEVAVKLQHPHLDEFCEIDMKMVEATLGWVKRWFPEFEFTWLGEEMRENLPKELDFVHEARNAERAEQDFVGIRTTLHIPRVANAQRRVLVMEYIRGARVDDLAYLAEHDIDRNKVAVELSRIFSRMLYLNGYFHADPHPGNLLVRPRPAGSRSHRNFEIVLLDHGLYFDLPNDLRINYARLWLSLIAHPTPEVVKERRRLAKLVGNIDPDQYYVFETALTGRANMSDSADEAGGDVQPADFARAGSMLDMGAMTESEADAIRTAVATREGVLYDVLAVLRRVPRRVLMVFKLNDLTRSLDHALATTHGDIRVFIVAATFCARAVFWDELSSLVGEVRERGVLAPSVVGRYFCSLWRYERTLIPLAFYGTVLDVMAWWRKTRAWMSGLRRGFEGAHKAAAGLPT